MPANYVLLEKITVGAAGASSVTFSSIPQTGYTDLVVKWSMRDTSASISNNVLIKINGVTTSQSVRTLSGNGSSASSYADTPLYVNAVVSNTATANTFSNNELYIPNYNSTTTSKSVSLDTVTENNATQASAQLSAGLYASNSAITSIEFAPNGAVTFVQGSTFYLYGVAKLGTTPAIVPYATGGDIIETDGTYWYLQHKQYDKHL